jgi:hypothetical protein
MRIRVKKKARVKRAFELTLTQLNESDQAVLV